MALLSGGLDSSVAAAWAARRYRLHLLHADYGQRTAARERQAFDAIAAALGVPQERRCCTRIDILHEVGGSSLTDPALPVERGEPVPSRIPGTYVPFRNAHLLAAAVSWAEVLGARSVVLGAVEEDSSGYPDCRAEFVRAFGEAVRCGTRPESGIAVEAPLLTMGKGAIVRLGLELGAPLHLTWSCYTEFDEACGACESCRLRLKGFREAGATDPIPYAGGAAGAGR